jgi:hypothetical protein
MQTKSKFQIGDYVECKTRKACGLPYRTAGVVTYVSAFGGVYFTDARGRGWLGFERELRFTPLSNPDRDEKLRDTIGAGERI